MRPTPSTPPPLPLSWTFDPLHALQRWPADTPLLLLHSGRHHPRWARRSILTTPTGAYRFTEADGSAWIGDGPAPAELSGDPFADPARLAEGDPRSLWVGHFSYDLGRRLEQVGNHAAADRDWPLVQLHHCPGYLVHDGATQRWSAHGAWADGSYLNLASRPPADASFAANDARPQMPRSEYERMVSQGIEYIAAGDVFQVNLAQRFTAEVEGDPRVLFRRLAAASPAWFGAYLELLADLPDGPRRAIASTSPELFLEVEGDGHVVTRPIKGTRPATVPPSELAASEKDAAELHMIVDLLRNDLGRVARFGSVRVEEARTIESHPTVHHGVATVRAQLRTGTDLADLLRATFPGGSITGAPKVRAMQIIDELEPVRRGPYCGAIGWLQGRRACLNIAIRTLLVERDAQGRGRADFSVGAGIVGDSLPASEYEETLDKAAAMMRALRGDDPPSPKARKAP